MFPRDVWLEYRLLSLSLRHLSIQLSIKRKTTDHLLIKYVVIVIMIKITQLSKICLLHFHSGFFFFTLIFNDILKTPIYKSDLMSSCSETNPKLYLHKHCKSLPIQDTLNVTNVTGWADNNRLYGQQRSPGSIWHVFTRTAGIQHCSRETTSIHTCLKEPVHITEAVWWNRGHCPVLIST